MTVPIPPIFVVDRQGVDLSVYASIADAELDLETIDVNNNEYFGYDSEGRLLELKTVHNKVVITPVEDRPSHVSDLSGSLREFLKAVNEPVKSDDLAVLVEACRKFTRRFS